MSEFLFPPMSTTRRTFIAASALTAAAPRLSGAPDGLAIARRHPLVRTQPTPTFFEGLLLGNGDIGVCLTVRPDALGLHIGKNDSWDIRVSAEHAAHIKPFAAVLELWRQAGEEARREGRPEMTYLETKIPAFREYTELMASLLPQAVAAAVAVRHRVGALGFAHDARGAAGAGHLLRRGDLSSWNTTTCAERSGRGRCAAS